jgi:hypothetical protein
MLASIKFFLGQDKADDELEEEEAGAGDDDGTGAAARPKAPSKEDVYKAYKAVSLVKKA